ncbi:MAG: DUF1549 domain-containing protein [Pirellulaceae bacterium]
MLNTEPDYRNLLIRRIVKLAGCLISAWCSSAIGGTVAFETEVAPILRQHCLSCHQAENAEGGLSLSSSTALGQGGESGPLVSPGDPDASLLMDMVSGSEPQMPQDAAPLSVAQIATLRQWIAEGANWPDAVTLEPPAVTDTDWWSLRPLQLPQVPDVAEAQADWVRTPIDAFILAKLNQHQLSPSPEADRRTLIRRLYFDLLGLPPTFEEVEEFVSDSDPQAYERLVDRLLESPHYGERWARHWLDVVHYGDTHGYDKDKPRPNAWPYRDYVIRSFNQDTPYSRFVQEQIAGDVLWPDSPESIEATGFIAAGPWDFIGHAEVPETKLDGQVARHLDRDDMVTTTMNTFASLTVQCARCHNHKFDPVTQEHYYSLQAVFAALDRTDRPYDRDAQVAQMRREWNQQLVEFEQECQQLEEKINVLAGERLAELDAQLATLRQQQQTVEKPEFGYHSQIATTADTIKWVQVDLGEPVDIRNVTVVACNDDFAGIGEGFGFPVRFKIEASTDREFAGDVVTLADRTTADFENPKCAPVSFEIDPVVRAVRYVRITATLLAERQSDYILALAELVVIDAAGNNVALGQPVQSLDSIEAPVRWQRSNLVDGYYFGKPADKSIEQQIADVSQQRSQHIAESVPKTVLDALATATQQREDIQRQLESLPEPSVVYCGAVHTGSGAFKGTGHNGGQPREIHVLARGNIQSRGRIVSPGTVPLIEGVDWQFELPTDHTEGDRRIALAQWLVRTDNPLTWRSIVNRIWLYHFGQAIVDSPNDFGRMGRLPSHPELLDWLAVTFRDNGQSLKQLHRLMVTSSVYRQVSADRPEFAQVDADNQFLWRMNRRVLDAESIRDAVLKVSGKLQDDLFGPPFQDFIVERPEHSPHYEYHLHDPNDPASHRRSIYRFLVRSQQQPFMQTLDCADPSESVAKRDTTLTALQALAMLNNKLIVCMSEHFAARAKTNYPNDVSGQVDFIHQEALGRKPDETTQAELIEFTQQFGLEYTCRVILNLNEFVFVD